MQQMENDMRMASVSLWAAVAAAVTCHPASAHAQGRPSILGPVVEALGKEGGEIVEDAVSDAASDGAYENSWRSFTRSRFRHVLEAPPGRHRLIIRATTDSPGGETVAIYPQTAGGERGNVRIGFVIATRAGNSEEIFVTIPQPPEGERVGRLPIVVDVENASGREFSGRYSIDLMPA